MMNQPNPILSSRDEEHMLGHGFYNKHSHEQGKANTYGLPLLVDAVKAIDFGQIGDEFRIADFGSAQGQNSLLPIKTAMAQIKALRGGLCQKSDSNLRYPHRFVDKRSLTPGSAFVEASGLSLIHFEERVLSDIYFEQYQQDRDAKAFAESYTGFFKAAFQPCLFVSLLDSRTPQSRQEVIDSFSQRLLSGLAQDPEKYSCRWFLQLMIIAKKSGPAN